MARRGRRRETETTLRTDSGPRPRARHHHPARPVPTASCPDERDLHAAEGPDAGVLERHQELRAKMRSAVRALRCGTKSARWMRWVPGLRTLGQYQASWLIHDLVAGVVLATMLVPVGIAYAVASGVPGIYGLYATIIPLLAYALFGPSR